MWTPSPFRNAMRPDRIVLVAHLHSHTLGFASEADTRGALLQAVRPRKSWLGWLGALDSGIDCAALIYKAVEVAHCLTLVGMIKARVWTKNSRSSLTRLRNCLLPPRNRRRQLGCAMCLIPNQASGASALAAAFVTVVLTGGPYVTRQRCAVLRPLLSRRHGLMSGSVSDQTGTCRPLDATPEDG